MASPVTLDPKQIWRFNNTFKIQASDKILALPWGLFPSEFHVAALAWRTFYGLDNPAASRYDHFDDGDDAPVEDQLHEGWEIEPDPPGGPGTEDCQRVAWSPGDAEALKGLDSGKLNQIQDIVDLLDGSSPDGDPTHVEQGIAEVMGIDGLAHDVELGAGFHAVPTPGSESPMKENYLNQCLLRVPVAVLRNDYVEVYDFLNAAHPDVSDHSIGPDNLMAKFVLRDEDGVRLTGLGIAWANTTHIVASIGDTLRKFDWEGRAVAFTGSVYTRTLSGVPTSLAGPSFLTTDSITLWYSTAGGNLYLLSMNTGNSTQYTPQVPDADFPARVGSFTEEDVDLQASLGDGTRNAYGMSNIKFNTYDPSGDGSLSEGAAPGELTVLQKLGAGTIHWFDGRCIYYARSNGGSNRLAFEKIDLGESFVQLVPVLGPEFLVFRDNAGGQPVWTGSLGSGQAWLGVTAAGDLVHIGLYLDVSNPATTQIKEGVRYINTLNATYPIRHAYQNGNGWDEEDHTDHSGDAVAHGITLVLNDYSSNPKTGLAYWTDQRASVVLEFNVEAFEIEPLDSKQLRLILAFNFPPLGTAVETTGASDGDTANVSPPFTHDTYNPSAPSDPAAIDVMVHVFNGPASPTEDHLDSKGRQLFSGSYANDKVMTEAYVTVKDIRPGDINSDGTLRLIVSMARKDYLMFSDKSFSGRVANSYCSVRRTDCQLYLVNKN